MATSAANRGKVAEKLFHNCLDDLNLRLHDFDYERLDDARSASGHMSKPRTGDFVVYSKGFSWAIEVKQVQHEFRLPRANFPRDQRARLKKREHAGGIPVLFVYFAPLEKWRVLNPSAMGTDDTGSWDLSHIQLHEKQIPNLYEILLNMTHSPFTAKRAPAC